LDDAVAFGYMWRDLTWVGLSPPDKATSQTHGARLRGDDTEDVARNRNYKSKPAPIDGSAPVEQFRLERLRQRHADTVLG
jgi:hypothetical protein